MNNDFFTPLDLHQRDRALMFPPVRSAPPRLDPLLAALGFGSEAASPPRPQASDFLGRGRTTAALRSARARSDFALLADASDSPPTNDGPAAGDELPVSAGAVGPSLIGMPPDKRSAAGLEPGSSATDPSLPKAPPSLPSNGRMIGAPTAAPLGPSSAAAVSPWVVKVQLEPLPKLLEEQIKKAARAQAELIVNDRFFLRDSQRRGSQ